MSAPPKSFHFVHVASDRKRISLPIGSFRVRLGSILSPCWVHVGSILGPLGVYVGSVLRLSSRIEFKFASDRPKVGPKSAHKQIKHISPKDLSYGINHFDATLASV